MNWLASNILLLAIRVITKLPNTSKKCFLTSQGVVGAGMNCRVLKVKNISYHVNSRRNFYPFCNPLHNFELS